MFYVDTCVCVCVCVSSQARTYAAEATPEPTVDVPLKLFSLPGKYATALYTTAAKEGNLKKVETDLKSVRTNTHTNHTKRNRGAVVLWVRERETKAAED